MAAATRTFLPLLPQLVCFPTFLDALACTLSCFYVLSRTLITLQAELDVSERTVDCSSALKGGASLSWLTVHSAPAVLGRLARHKLPATHRRAPDRQHAVPCPRDSRADALCGYRTNTTCYQPVPYTYRCPAAPAADSADDAYRTLSPSLRLAKPVLAETQYWV